MYVFLSTVYIGKNTQAKTLGLCLRFHTFNVLFEMAETYL